MYIQSTATKHPKSSPTRTTAAGKLAAELSAGRIPEDMYIKPGKEVAEGQPKLGEGLPVNHRSQSVKSARRRNTFANVVMAPMTAAPGALLGSMAFPNAPFVGAAVGAGIGVAMALDWGREFNGTVKIESGDEVVKRKWYGAPENFERKPSELHTIFHATGVLGDKVELVPFQPEGQSDPKLLKELTAHKDTLKSLAAQRRLLADLGGKSRYGKPAMQVIDPVQARELLGRGRPISVIDVTKSQDVEHELTTKANSGIHHKKSLKTYGYTEKQLDYQSQTIREIADLNKVLEGQGLPESVLGVPRDEQDFQQVVYRKQESADRTIKDKKDQSYQELREVLIGDASPVGQGQRLGSVVKGMVDPSTRGYAITGAVLGAVTGMATGVDPAVSLTIGGFAGHFIGRQAVARRSEGEQAGSTLTKVASGVGAVAGMGIGVLAASAADPSGAMVAAIAVGATGGLFSGALLGRGKGEVGKTLAMGGFTLGSFIGMGVAATGGGPLASVALGALGGVAGGCFGYIATRGK
jgi:hypothetical protein